MAITSLGSQSFTSNFNWQSFNPIQLDRDSTFALLFTVTSPDPSLVYSSFAIRTINIFDSGDSGTSFTLASFTYDSETQFFPYQSWRGYDRNEDTIFQVRREPFFSDLSGLSGSTVELLIDPAFTLS